MIFLGADHGGFELKEKIKQWLSEWGWEFVDVGAEQLDREDDYPVYAEKVARAVAENRSGSWREQSKGILACRSGGGMVIAANKIPGIRAVYVDSVKSAVHSRSDNDANVMSLAADWVAEEEIREAVKVWLETEFSGEERHKRRLAMIARLEGVNEE